MGRVFVNAKMKAWKLMITVFVVIIGGISGFMLLKNPMYGTVIYFGYEFSFSVGQVKILAYAILVLCPLVLFFMIQKYRNPVHLDFDEKGLTFSNPKIDLVLWEDIISIAKAKDRKEKGFNALGAFNKVYPIRFIIANSEHYLGKDSRMKDGSFEIVFHVIDTQYSTNALIELLEMYRDSQEEDEIKGED